jgi:hypothetical protein
MSLKPSPRATRSALLLLLLTAAPAAAQPTMKVKVERVEVGFRSQAERPLGSLFLPGLWTPVGVTLNSGGDGQLTLPAQADGTCRGHLFVEGTDGDGGQNVYAAPFVLPAKGRVTVLGYTMPGSTSPELSLSLAADAQPERRLPLATRSFNGLGLHQHVYLTLGARLPELQTAASELTVNLHEGESGPRHAGAETEVARLPDRWFGYQAVDFVVLAADDDFLADLGRSPERAKALADWVAQGGRLLISLSWRNQDRARKLLAGAGWPAAVAAAVPPYRPRPPLRSLAGLQTWANILNKPFPISPARPLQVAALQPGKEAEVLIREETGEPLLVRLCHGRGSIALLALELDRAPFTTWTGKVDFWKALLARLAPRVQAGSAQAGVEAGLPHEDIGARLHRELDDFDVPVISFGWVAFFILLYILVVGPLDYLLVKKVFKRLEWTWFTYPAVVLLVSIAAYVTASAIKGNELQVNKVDLVDVDQRSNLDETARTRQAHAYGTTWLAVLSPEIKSYTVGIEPALTSWTASGTAQASPGTVSWLGRPEAMGQGGIGRQHAQTLFSRAYTYAPDAAGLRDVPIPIWTTKAFTATWDVSFSQPPFDANLSYRPADPDQRMAGTIRSRLPVDLVDVYLFYGLRAFPLEGGLPGGKDASPVNIVLDPARAIDADRWGRIGVLPPARRDADSSASRQPFAPTGIIKELLFADFAGVANHSLRALDQSWRLRELQARDQGVRDIILVGRLPRAEGPAEQLAAQKDHRLATQLWLSGDAHELPGAGQPRPTLSGTLVQDTFVRVFLPVRPE